MSGKEHLLHSARPNILPLQELNVRSGFSFGEIRVMLISLIKAGNELSLQLFLLKTPQ